MLRKVDEAGKVELELEDVWSDVQSLRKLYGLLHISGNVEEREGSENLDEKSRFLLKRLLDGATQQAFQFQAKRSTAQIGRPEPPSLRVTCQKRSRRESPDVTSTSVPPSPYLPVRLLGPNPENMGRKMKDKSPRKPKPVLLQSRPKSPPTPHTPRRTRKAGPTKPSLPRHRVKTINSLDGSSETSSSDSAPRILPRHQQLIRTRERRPERLSHRVDSGATKRKDRRKDGRLKRIKDKLSYLRSVVHRTGKKDHGKLAIEGGAAKDLERRTANISPSHGYFHRLLEQLVRHVWRAKGRGGRANATHVRLGRWQRFRRRTNKKKPRLRIGFRKSVPRRLMA
ncbi:hypothetical protein QJS10_CPA01g03037 [Acorus calamus]|uniref:Uncharacterized protein n=1 Tax=Acorus calamus TaxID=4465 RepID=A0AAV9FG01_ACOCL|nr:hypothetical protein QJS10_CPA01g03037 [Acorus calamus]